MGERSNSGSVLCVGCVSIRDAAITESAVDAPHQRNEDAARISRCSIDGHNDVRASGLLGVCFY